MDSSHSVLCVAVLSLSIMNRSFKHPPLKLTWSPAHGTPIRHQGVKVCQSRSGLSHIEGVISSELPSSSEDHSSSITSSVSAGLENKQEKLMLKCKIECKSSVDSWE